MFTGLVPISIPAAFKLLTSYSVARETSDAMSQITRYTVPHHAMCYNTDSGYKISENKSNMIETCAHVTHSEQAAGYMDNLRRR